MVLFCKRHLVDDFYRTVLSLRSERARSSRRMRRRKGRFEGMKSFMTRWGIDRPHGGVIGHT